MDFDPKVKFHKKVDLDRKMDYFSKTDFDPNNGFRSKNKVWSKKIDSKSYQKMNFDQKKIFIKKTRRSP